MSLFLRLKSSGENGTALGLLVSHILTFSSVGCYKTLTLAKDI